VSLDLKLEFPNLRCRKFEDTLNLE
jgi:hypothetical protein